MKKICLCISFLFIYVTVRPQQAEWPILKHYDQDHLLNIALPLGGIGTGTVSLGGRGELRDWEIMNKPAKGFSTVTKGNNAPFFSIYVKPYGESPVTRALIGPVHSSEFMHYEGRPVNQHGFPRFARASFDASYPVGIVNLSDSSMPVKVKITGFNPLIPGDADASGLPVAVLEYEVTNMTDKSLEVSVCGTIRNFIGNDGSKYHRDWKGDFIPDGARNNQNIFRQNDTICGIYMYSNNVAKTDAAYGSIALTTDDKSGISYRRSSEANNWERATLDFWDDFSSDGNLTDKSVSYDNDPMASLAVKKKIDPRGTLVFRFFITWYFPNRYAWSDEVVGNYYCTKYVNAWDAANKIIPRISELKEKTRLFLNAFLSSSLPEVVKESALFNLSTLRSQTVFRIKSGHMMGWEGVMDDFGSCYGSCTHVWNYEVATPFLFGSLACTMRDVELNSVMKYNYVADFSSRFNNMRSYVMGRESGLIMASWPNGRLKVPFPYFAESMTGFEYAAAVAMIYEGQILEGQKCISSIRARFDGYKRNPFDEPECGHHYARAMASWASVIALSGFRYSAIEKSISFTSQPGIYFWSNGYAWGTCRVEKDKAILSVLKGSIYLDEFHPQGKKTLTFPPMILIEDNTKVFVFN